jgi:hypothetical protein
MAWAEEAAASRAPTAIVAASIVAERMYEFSLSSIMARIAEKPDRRGRISTALIRSMRCDFVLHYGAVVEVRKRENITNSRMLDATEMSRSCSASWRVYPLRK